MKNKIFLCLLVFASIGSRVSWGQNTTIPDPNFEQALVDLNIDTDGMVNGVVLTDDISDLTELNVFNRNIADLTGIEAFVNLEVLNCSGNKLTTLNISSNTALVNLNCSSNSLTALNLLSNTGLVTLNCQNNALSNLNVSANTVLQNLDFTDNDVVAINVNNNQDLVSLKCANNRLNTLNIANNRDLQELVCSANNLNALNVSANTELSTLFCASNNLASLDVSANSALTLLNCSANQITTLDVSANAILEQLTSSANQLTSLNVTSNDSLTLLAFANNQLTTIDVGNNQDLLSLIASSNLLSTIDVSSNPLLRTLDVSVNLIEQGNFDINDSLTSLNVNNNRLRSLSVKNGNNGALGSFSSLNNPDLICINIDDEMQIGSNWLKDNSASFSSNCAPLLTVIPDANFEQALIDLGFDSGAPDGLVVTDSINTVTSLDVSSRMISDLTGIEDFTRLAVLDCSDNQIMSLELIDNTLLTDIDCSSNALTSLIVRNNNNQNLITFDARNNTSLTCIAVDDPMQIGAMWQKDGAASYSSNCLPGTVFIPDDNFEQALIDLGLDTGSPDNYVTTAAVDTVTVLDVNSKNISTLTGIEAFSSLTTLDCSNNLLLTLDVSQNTTLTSLACFQNYLNQLDVSANTSLINFSAGGNRLADLDVSQNTSLEELIVDSNFLTNLNTSANINLLRLNVNSNNLTDIGFDITSNVLLEEIFCSNNNLTDIDITQNTLLLKIDCSGNQLQNIDIRQNTMLRRFEASSNFLTNLNVASNPSLDSISINSNLISSLDLTANPLLKMLSAEDNNLDNIDLSANISLEALFVSGNRLTALDITSNTLLKIFESNENQLTNLDVSANASLETLFCSSNQLAAIDVSNNMLLQTLNVDGNNISSLVTSGNPNLQVLSFSRNNVSTLDISTNSQLTNLTCDNNELSILNLESISSLVSISCSANNLMNLDLSGQSNLTAVSCSSNELISLNVRNGNNMNLIRLGAINNPDLTCIEIDDINNISATWQKDVIASFSENCHFDETFVPDDNFEAALAQFGGEPDNNDDYILTEAISSFTGLSVSGFGISDLTGVEAMPLLIILNISDNNIDSLNLEILTDLEELNASNNQLTQLDVSNNKALTTLNLSSNMLTSIGLDSLRLLQVLLVENNLLEELNLDVNENLTSVNVSTNELVSLSIQNGNNVILTDLDVTNNADLTCIQIDNVDNPGTAWLKDDQASYSEDCHFNETFVPDDAFEQALIDLGLDYTATGPLDDYIPTPRIELLTSLNISNNQIVDLTGIEDFINLISFDCSDNQIENLDLENSTKLEFIDCARNELTNLEVISLDSLRNLNASGNDIGSLDLTQNINLARLDFSSNRLVGIDITQNVNLTQVIGQGNALFTVDANNGFNERISTFDLTNNPSLTCILVDNVDSANAYVGWVKDEQSEYKLVCDDDDNDGVVDEDDLCPTTPFGTRVDLFGCAVFTLPVDNFTVKTTSESCRGGNNGLINIEAEQILDYTATLISELDSITTYNFGDKVEIRNVRAGQYELCITVGDQPAYQQCYILVITEPEDLKVLSSGRKSNGRVSYDMTGSDHYEIDFNGRKFETSDDHITLSLLRGRNLIKIKTKADCQGVFEESIYYTEDIFPFPNPFIDDLKVSMGQKETEEVNLFIYNISGTLMMSKTYEPTNGIIDHVDISTLPKGLYIMELIWEKEKRTFKITKQ